MCKRESESSKYVWIKLILFTSYRNINSIETHLYSVESNGRLRGNTHCVEANKTEINWTVTKRSWIWFEHITPCVYLCLCMYCICVDVGVCILIQLDTIQCDAIVCVQQFVVIRYIRILSTNIQMYVCACACVRIWMKPLALVRCICVYVHLTDIT